MHQKNYNANAEICTMMEHLLKSKTNTIQLTGEYKNFQIQKLHLVDQYLLKINNKDNKVQTGIYLFKFNKGNTRTICKICSSLSIKTAEQRQWRHFCVFIVNFGQISQTSPVLSLLSLKR